MKRFQDRVAVVTGAAGGIGRAISEALAKQGCQLALADVDATGLAETASRVEALGRRASQHIVDVANRERMAAFPEEVVHEHGAAHIVVNNAGVTVAKQFADHNLDDLEWIVGINFWGVVYGCKYFLPVLLEQDEAHIVNLSSMFGFIGVPGQSSYCATKFAVRGLSEAMYAELSGTNVGVTSVHPGFIKTSIVSSSRSDDEGLRQRSHDLFARIGSPPERVARGIVKAIARRRLRVIVTPEARVTEWVKRLFPTGTQRLIARGFRSMQNEAQASAADGWSD